MANKIQYYINDDGNNTRNIHLFYMLEKALQSSNINFLIGSGASYPAIELMGSIEQEIDELLDSDEAGANRKKCEFLNSVIASTNQLASKGFRKENATLLNYKEWLRSLVETLLTRNTPLLPRQATIFTTNYDLFIESAFEEVDSSKLNDGFERSSNLTREFKFSPQNFFETSFKIGNLYDYKVELPSINLVKLHGSLSWKEEVEDIFYQFLPIEEANEENLNLYGIVFPQRDKHRQTVIQIYYDLLRIYANELDKRNSLLIVFGFSFADQHILRITERALKNPTLLVIIFAWQETAVDEFVTMFQAFNNVLIIEPIGGKIEFTQFNAIFGKLFPPKKRKAVQEQLNTSTSDESEAEQNGEQ